MRVLMLGWEFPPRHTGGLGTACRGMVKALTRRGVDVLLVLPRVQGGEDAGTAHIVDGHAILEDDELASLPGAAALEAITIDSPLRPYAGRNDYETAHGPAGGPYAGNLEREVERYAFAVCRVVRREAFDVIHAHDWMTYPGGLLAKRMAERPLLCHVHSLEHDRRGADGDPVIASLEERGLRGADRVVCVSHRTAKDVAEYHRVPGQRIRVVHNGVDTSCPLAREAGTGEDEPRVLFLGRLVEQKGPAVFLEAAARVARARPDARFVVAGDGPLHDELVTQASRLHLGDRVRFTGFLDAEAVTRMYDSAAVYVMPSASEPFGLTSLEALARGIPVIASAGSGVTEVLSNALTVEPGDVEALADKILAVLRYPALRRQLAEEGRAEAERLGWDRCADSLREVYGELMS